MCRFDAMLLFFLSSLYSVDLDGGILCLLFIFNKKKYLNFLNCKLQLNTLREGKFKRQIIVKKEQFLLTSILFLSIITMATQ